MKVNDFLTSLGWPEDRLEHAGQAKWSGAGSDGLSTLRATLERDAALVVASVKMVGLEGSESLLLIEARVAGDELTVVKSVAGEPPEAIPAEDASHVFSFMRSGLGEFKFTSMGPLRLPMKISTGLAG